MKYSTRGWLTWEGEGLDGLRLNELGPLLPFPFSVASLRLDSCINMRILYNYNAWVSHLATDSKINIAYGL